MTKQKRTVREVGTFLLNKRYKIVDIIHTAGMSNLYKAVDTNLGSHWAIKEILKSQAGKNKLEYRSILQEADLMKSLNNPYIPRITSIETEGDSVFIVMDFVTGKSLQDILQSSTRIDQSAIIPIMSQVAAVMKYLHNLNPSVIYRDLKPSNIMLSVDGSIRLIDFGISRRMTETGYLNEKALGTRGFAPPEQLLDNTKLDVRSDIFSFGSTFYTCLTGIMPKRDNLRENSIYERVSIRDIDASISINLNKIIMKCVERDIDKRYKSFDEILYDLQNIDTFSKEYKNRLKWKVIPVISGWVLSLMLIVGGTLLTFKRSEIVSSQYNSLIQTAESTKSLQDYGRAIEIKPNIIDPYFSMVEAIKEDGLFSQEEESSLLQVVNSNITSIQQNPRFTELSFEIGRLYWFYSDSDNAKSSSVKWLYDASREDEEARVLYDIGDFQKTIKSLVIESRDSGVYSEFYSNLMKARNLNSDSDLVRVNIEKAIVDCLKSYAHKLKQENISLDELKETLNKSKEILSSVTSDNQRVLSIKAEVESALPLVEESLNVVWR